MDGNLSDKVFDNLRGELDRLAQEQRGLAVAALLQPVAAALRAAADRASWPAAVELINAWLAESFPDGDGNKKPFTLSVRSARDAVEPDEAEDSPVPGENV